MVKIIFLGTGQAIPTAKRNHTSIFLQLNGENMLVDCGENTQRQFRKAKLNPCKLTRILITHWHGDHVLGLPGLMQTLVLNGCNRTIHIYGPRGTKKYLKLMNNLFVFVGKINLKIHEISSGKIFETDDFYVESFPVQHKTPCNAYVFIEKEKRRIKKQKLRKYKIPNSPELKKLQQGKSIIFNGKKIKASDVTYIEKGKKISFVLDTTLCDNVYKAAKNSDVLVIESTYIEDDRKKLGEYHLSAKIAAQIAKKSKVKKLILTHISQRYDKDEDVVLKEAKKTFKNTVLSHDFMEIEV